LEIMMGIFESAAYGIRVDLPQKDRQHPLLRWRADRHSNEELGDLDLLPRDYSSWLSRQGIERF
jgi:hypothetical protein